MTKYYYAGASRIAMRQDGDLFFVLGDHLGSASLVTDDEGTIISETKYKAWGEVRYSSGSNPSEYTYTGQYSYTNDFGLMFYNARWYDPSLGRFAQADTIVPSGVQGLDRYAYVNNSPINYIDPSGHTTCDADGYCGYNTINQRNQNGGSGNSLMGCRLDCTLHDLDNADMQERLDWFRWLTNHMDGTIGDGTSEWFNNIDGIVDTFVSSGQSDNQWMLAVDANILTAVKDGYVAFLNGEAVDSDSGAGKWKEFFFELDEGIMSENELIGLWGQAEQAGTNEGYWRAYTLGYGGAHWWKTNWITTDYGLDDIGFSFIGDMYRGSGSTLCKLVSCAGGFFDPRTKWGSQSPVWSVAHGVYFMDTIGYSLTGH